MLCEFSADQCEEVHLGLSISDFPWFFRWNKLLMPLPAMALGHFSGFSRWLVSSLHFETPEAGPSL